jgi:hypothetical protein
VIARYVGEYEFSNGQKMTARIDGGHLVLQTAGAPALTLLAESETRFFIRDRNLQIEFVRDTAGTVTELVAIQGTLQERAKRVK